jgi:transposase InsO family protein
MANPTRILAINNTDDENDTPDAIKSLSIHGLKTLRNHFSNDTAAISVNDVIINVLDMDLQKRIATAQEMDIPVKEAMNMLLKKNPNMWKDEMKDWTMELLDEGVVLFFKGRNYIPKDDNLRRDILKMYHDHETAGHPGELETYNAVAQQYWWPGIRTFVKNYVKGCGICQQFKIDRNPSHPAFLPIPGAPTTRPFAHCSMDLITDLPLSNTFDSILVVVDQGLSKGVILCPCTKTITSDGVAQLLFDNLFKRFGLPNKIISDRGPQFAARAFKELLKLLGITSSLTTAYHPQSDGATERVNQEIEAYLSIYCISNPENWSNTLSTLEFTHNNRRHADRKHSPFELIQGESPIALPITFEHTKFPTIEDKIKLLIRNREEALAAHELARSRMAARKKDTFTPFVKGQKVWLDLRNLKTSYHKKITPKREGPFEIEEVLGPVTYRLKLPESWKIHNVFHAILLRPYIENETHGGNFPRPIPELIEGEEVYEVDSIIKHRRRGRGYQYYIKWKGYPITEATWENETAFSDDGDMLEQYKKQHQL